MPYCRKCGTKLEENARFCPKCGTPVVAYTYAPAHPAAYKPIRNDPIVLAAVILAVILVSAVIISIIIFAPIKPFSFGQTNEVNQPNVNTIYLNFQANNAQINIITQSPTNQSVVFYTSASGSTSIFNSKNPADIAVTNQTNGSTLTVNAKVTSAGLFGSAPRVTCDIWLNPSMRLNLNVTTQTGQVTLIANQTATFESLNLKSNAGEVRADLLKGTMIVGDLSLKTTTGAVMFRMNQANVEGNRTFNLQTTTGTVIMDIAENQTLPGNVQVNASTSTGAVDLTMFINNGVGAKIESQTNLGSVRTDLSNFSGNKSPIRSNNYPAESNFLMSLKTNLGSININAAYQSTTSPSTKN
jgi:hypothetical protein